MFPTPHFAAVLRMATALICLIKLHALGSDFNLFFLPDGLINKLLLLVHGKSILPATVHLPYVIGVFLKIGYTFCCLLLFLGFFSKIASSCLFFIHCIIFISMPAFSYGADYFCQTALFFCLLFPIRRYPSIDHLLFKSVRYTSFADQQWQCLLQIYLSIVYFFSGFNKALSNSWWNGEAVWKALHLPYFRIHQTISTTIDTLPIHLFVVIGCTVVLLELLYPLLLFCKPIRTTYCACMIALHVSIGLLLGLWVFSFIMISLNACAWIFSSQVAITSAKVHKNTKNNR